MAMSHHLVDFDGKILRNTAQNARLQTAEGMFSNNVRVALFSDTANALLMRLLISSLKSITNAFLNGQLVLTFRLSFLYFPRQIAENEFQLKSTILCDIAQNKNREGKMIYELLAKNDTRECLVKTNV